MSLPFGPPYPVSPLIRGARFAFLFAGILYGRIKLTGYRAMDKKWRAEEAKNKIIRDRQNAILKEQIEKEEQNTINLLEQGQINDGGSYEDDGEPKAYLVPPVRPKPCGHDSNRPNTFEEAAAAKAKPCEYDPNLPEPLSMPKVKSIALKDGAGTSAAKPVAPSEQDDNLPRAVLGTIQRVEPEEYIEVVPKAFLVPVLKPKPYDPDNPPEPEPYDPPPNPYARYDDDDD